MAALTLIISFEKLSTLPPPPPKEKKEKLFFKRTKFRAGK
jgi:hypothetical protein